MKYHYLLKSCTLRVIQLLAFILAVTPVLEVSSQDWRNIRNGHIIPDRSYSDQPYVVKTDDGAWLLTMTTALGREGADTQHITTQRSFDQGKTWQDLVEVESPDGPEASYAVILKDPDSNRVFVFYNHNTDNVRQVKTEPALSGGRESFTRVDSLGYFVFKYSDDHGKSWSDRRITIPVRETEIDRQNVYGGKIRFHWTVGKAFAHEGIAYVPLHKVGGFGEGFFTSNEGVLLKSTNLFTVKDPATATWETLPDGEIGLRTPEGGGPIASEQSFSVMSDGSFFVVYRTIDGYPVFSYSRDGGHHWEAPQYMRYSDGRLVKHPRAANFAWRCENGNYLYWFHNHGGRWLGEQTDRRSVGYRDRNPAWVMGGHEVDGPNGKLIEWSQPEVLFYDDDPLIRMSYPDLIEEAGNYYFTETQKDVARVHQADTAFLDLLWRQPDIRKRTTDGLAASWEFPKQEWPQVKKAIELDDFYVRSNVADHAGKHVRSGFSIELSLRLDQVHAGQVLIDTRDEWGKGLWLETSSGRSLKFSMSDGRAVSSWSSDLLSITKGKEHQISIIVDGGPKIIMFVIDGILNDGGDSRRFGWGRFNPYIHDNNGGDMWSIGSEFSGDIHSMHVYTRALKVTEAIGNFREYSSRR